MRYICRLWVNKKGKVNALIVTFPQLSFLFQFVSFSLLTFLFWFKQDMERTGLFAGLFGMGMTYVVAEQLFLEIEFIKAFKNFFKKK